LRKITIKSVTEAVDYDIELSMKRPLFTDWVGTLAFTVNVVRRHAENKQKKPI